MSLHTGQEEERCYTEHMAYDIFELQGTPTQNQIVLNALQQTTFPWEKLQAKLLATKGKTKIPVEWADLTTYQEAAATEAAPVGNHDDHDHHHHDEEPKGFGHTDIVVNGEKAHGISFRSQVLGLAWYSGKVSLDISLQTNPTLAGEVFLSEGAHMIDFFFMTEQQRQAIFNAFHGDNTAAANSHGCAWFDVGDYYTWVGEAFMGGFIKAYSTLPVTIAFTHPPTTFTSKRIREILTPAPITTVKKKESDIYLSSKFTKVFHMDHKGYRGSVQYDDREAAVAAGKRPCKVCRA